MPRYGMVHPCCGDTRHCQRCSSIDACCGGMEA
jgi:hypothetical protein